MEKRFRILFFLALFLIASISLISASQIDDEIKKITHYAAEYETGNMNYVQFLIYTSAIRSRIGEIAGASEELGGVFSKEQLKAVLGEPQEKTNWVWFENEKTEKKVNENVPVWRKIVFDGNKMQVRLNAYPSIYEQNSKQELVYHVVIDSDFKNPKEQLNINEKISIIRNLAENFNKNPTNEQAEALARESVNVEKSFEAFYRQSSEKCEDVMKGIFGAENQRQEQKLLTQKISFFIGENFEVMMWLEFCDDCEWNWINLEYWFEGKGPGFKEPKAEIGEVDKKEYENLNFEEFENALKKELDEIKNLLEHGNYKEALSKKSRIQAINWAWNEKANNVWPEVNYVFESRREAMAEKERETYDWKKEEQERKLKEKEMIKENYEKRKSFYLNLFQVYEKKEAYSSMLEFEKKLVEEFEEKNREDCENNKDDNNDNKIDCEDEQCFGRICKRNVVSDSEKELVTNFFCVQKVCQQKQEFVRERKAVCGNHVCDEGEKETCKQDCAECKKYKAIECRGNVIFKGKDENNCPLEPVCLEESESCEKDEDCFQPLCGKSACQESRCKTINLEECREEECVAGDERVKECLSKEKLVVEKCIEGVWRNTGLECEGEEIKPEKPIAGEECKIREDCGNENDVCSNGKCITIPESIEPVLPVIKPEEPVQEQTKQVQQEQLAEQAPAETPAETAQQSQPTAQTQPSSTEPVTGQIVKAIKTITGKITGFIISGFAAEDATEESGEDKESGAGEESKEKLEEGEEDGEEKLEEAEEAGEKKEEKTEEIKVGEGHEENKEAREEKKEEEKEKREKGVFRVGGTCRISPEKTEAYIYFGGWGEPFEKIERIKGKYYAGGQADWCKEELENMIKKRKELEKSLNDEFVKWFFEKYLAGSAEDWEQQISGIFEVYWRDIDISRQMALSLNCLEKNELPEIKLINIKYDTEYGSLEFWEEVKNAKIPGIEQEMQLISPYMKIWIFPPKEFLKYEFKKAMKIHEFPGPKKENSEDKGPSEEEKAEIKKDKKLMEKIRKFAEKYKGNDESIDAAIQFKENEELVFNLYAKVNEEDIIEMVPVLPEEMKQQDIKVELNYDELYDIIYTSEKEMRGMQLESPPWDRKIQPMQKVKEVVNGIKIFLKVRSMVSNAKITPEEAEKDVKSIFNSFFSMMLKQGTGGKKQEEKEAREAGEKAEKNAGKSVTGQMIKRFGD